MIGDIRSKWIRRPLVVLAFIVAVVLLLACKACALVFDYVDEEIGDSTRDSWAGPRKDSGRVVPRG